MEKTLEASYKYEPLEHSWSIRLVTIYPGTRRPGGVSDPVRCELKLARLDQDPHYEALSYLWGSPMAQESIQIDGAQFLVTRNLHAAILRLRSEQTSSTFWIDAICINQQDITERNKQVALMGIIYRAASRVTVWLGEESHLDKKSMALTLQTLEKLGSGPLLALRAQILGDGLKDATGSLVYNTLKTELQTFSSPFSKDAHVWKMIRSFLDQAWFHRGWIFQEVALSLKSTRVQCDHVSFDFEMLRQACLSIAAFGLTSSLASSGRADELIRHIGYVQDSVRGTSYHLDLRLSSLLSARRSCLCTDPRDKVFALLGLASDAQGLSPDYYKSVAEVYSETAKCILRTDKGTLSLLSEVKGLRLGSELPSWVPDWRIDPKVMPLASTNSNDTKRYRASGMTLPKFTIAAEEQLLSIHGVLFDKVSQHLGKTPSTIGNENYITKVGLISYIEGAWPEMIRSVYPNGIYTPTGEPLVQAYNRVITADQLLISERLDDSTKAVYYPETLALINANGSPAGHPLFPHAFKQIENFDIDLSAAIRNYVKGPELYTMQDIEKALYRDPLVDGIPNEIFGHVNSELEAIRWALTEGRRLFISSAGHMGLCPEATEPDDVIYIFIGSDVPFVLRPLRNGNYLLVGECYLDGFMDGRALLEVSKVADVDDACGGFGTFERKFVLE